MTIREMIHIKEDRGYSFSKLSEYTGIPAVTIQKIFSGKTKNPRKATLNALERVLKGDESLYAGKAYSYGINGIHPDGHDNDGVMMVRERKTAYGSKKDGEYTVEDYFALPEDYRAELIDGVFYDMATPGFVHQDIIGAIYYTFSNYIRNNKGKCRAIMAPSAVQLDCDDKTMLEPDLYVICDREKIRKFGIYGAPDFVLEVLSPSNRKKDMMLKMAKYGEAGVREYWIIDPEKRVLITYDFTDENMIPVVMPLMGSAPVLIYDGKLSIDLDEINDIIEEFLRILE